MEIVYERRVEIVLKKTVWSTVLKKFLKAMWKVFSNHFLRVGVEVVFG